MGVRIIQGDVRDVLPTLAADSFDCIVTSPPYYGLRDYGTATWEGGDDPKCDHIGPPMRTNNKPSNQTATFHGGGSRATEPMGTTCKKCGARRIDAQIGLEPTLDAYLETMVAVCRELRRVLKPSGVFFLNCGDSYNNFRTQMGPGQALHGRGELHGKPAPDSRQRGIVGLKEKDVMLVPERLGIALQADGWWVRSHIIWAKKNPMPESVTDRPTNAHETIWMLTKSARYFWDAEAVKEEGCGAPDMQRRHGNGETVQGPGGCYRVGGTSSRNIRNVWSVASHPFPGAHFATMPPEIAERCIKAGSSERGCCPACGKPWVRITDGATYYQGDDGARTRKGSLIGNGHGGGGRGPQNNLGESIAKTLGWKPSCKCPAAVPGPARILDPFAGPGTTGLVADRLGRDATLIDLNTSYINMAVNRIRDDAPLFAEVAAE